MNGARTDPRRRLQMLALFSAAVLMLDTVPALAAVWVLAIAVFIAARPRGRSILVLVALSVATVWGFAFTQGIFYPFRPRTVLFELVPAGVPIFGSLTGGIVLYAEGLVYGLIQSMRFMALLTAGLTLVMTTSAQQLLDGLRRVRIPYPVAFMTATAVRFVPAVTRETRIVLDAMQMRGMPLRPSRPWRYLPALLRALPAIVTRNLRRATTLADAVESKGFALRGLIGDRLPQNTGGHSGLVAAAAAVVGLLAGIKMYGGLALRFGWNDSLTGWIHELSRRFL